MAKDGVKSNVDQNAIRRAQKAKQRAAAQAASKSRQESSGFDMKEAVRECKQRERERAAFDRWLRSEVRRGQRINDMINDWLDQADAGKIVEFGILEGDAKQAHRELVVWIFNCKKSRYRILTEGDKFQLIAIVQIDKLVRSWLDQADKKRIVAIAPKTALQKEAFADMVRWLNAQEKPSYAVAPNGTSHLLAPIVAAA